MISVNLENWGNSNTLCSYLASQHIVFNSELRHIFCLLYSSITFEQTCPIAQAWQFSFKIVLIHHSTRLAQAHNLEHTLWSPSIAQSIAQRKSEKKKMKGVNNAWNINVSNSHHHCHDFKWNWLLLISQITHIWLAHRCRGHRKHRDSQRVSSTLALHFSISLRGINDVCLITGWN